MCLTACGASPHESILEVSAGEGLSGELPRLLPATPLPEGWTVREVDGRQGSKRPRLDLTWEAAASVSQVGQGQVVIRRRWLSPAIDFYDPRYSLSQAEARAIGLVDLEGIKLPERACAVDGRFPGEEGYPFEEVLVARLEGAGLDEGGSVAAWFKRLGAEAARSPEPEPFLMDAAGDMQIGPEEAPWLAKGEDGLARLFGGMKGELKRPAILVGNLEMPITARGEANPRKRFQFRAPPGTTAALKAAGFDLLLFANNHTLDFGSEGFEDSLADAKASGLPLVGVGDSSAAALMPQRLAAPGFSATDSMSFIGFGNFPAENRGFTTEEAAAGADKAGINADEDATVDVIKREAQAGNYVVLLCHGGAEYRFEPTAQIVARYRRFVDAGARIVLGSHPHLLQGAEAYHGGLIAYSLGNFLFTGEAEPPNALESALLELLCYKGELRGIGLVPVRASIKGTDRSASPDATVAAFARRSAALPVTFPVSGGRRDSPRP